MAFLPPGVPPLLPSLDVEFSQVVLAVGDAVGLGLGGFGFTEWGLFDQSGQAVIVADSVVAFDNDAEARISNYPVEQGGFESFNKVQTPYDVVFVFTKGGSISDRANFLAAIDAAKNSLALLTGVTPEKSYINLNVQRYSQTRAARQGVTLLTVNVYCQEIRQAPPLLFSNTQNFSGVGQSAATPTLTDTQAPDGSSPVNGGTVQGVPPTSQTTTFATDQAPGAIQTPMSSLTNSTGNSIPASVSSPVGSTITFNDSIAGRPDLGGGPGTGVVSSVDANGNYNLVGGGFVGKNIVTSITPAGFTTVQ